MQHTQKKKTIAILIGIILLATALRFYGIAKESYWLDEAISVRDAQASYAKTITSLKEDVHMPLYSTILWGWVRAFGTGEFATRSLSAIFGIALVAVTFLLGRRLFDERSGLIAAGIIAFSPIDIYYSQETRYYCLFTLLAGLSMLAYASYLQRPSKKGLVIYAIPTIALWYTNIFAALVIAAQTLHFAWTQRRAWKQIIPWAVAHLAILVLFLPWLLIFIRQTKNLHHLAWVEKPAFASIIGVYVMMPGIALLLTLFIVIIACFIIHDYAMDSNTGRMRQKIMKKNQGLLLLWLLFPPTVLFVLSEVTQPVFLVRYFLFVLPALALLAGSGISRMRHAWMRAGIVLLILALSTTLAIQQERRMDKDDWRSLTTYLTEHRTTGDIVIINPYYHMDPYAYYAHPSCLKAEYVGSCMDKEGILSLSWNASCCTDTTPLTSTTAHNTLLDYMDRTVWLVSVRSEEYDRNNSLFSYIASRKKITQAAAVGDIKIYRFQ